MIVKPFSHMIFAAVFTVASGLAHADEIKVFSTIGVQAALEELAPKFEKETNSKLSITWATAAMLVKRAEGGDEADCYVLTAQALDTFRRKARRRAVAESLRVLGWRWL